MYLNLLDNIERMTLIKLHHHQFRNYTQVR